MFDVFPSALVKMIPGIVDICSVDGDSLNLTACISGEPSHVHHHFELILKGVLPVQIHALSLAAFASLVAPFGGFLASGEYTRNKYQRFLSVYLKFVISPCFIFHNWSYEPHSFI